jgi:site-specific recombinase XerD
LNKDLKKIAKKLKIDVDLTSYVLRHSFATTLRRKGASVEKISQAMGHRNTDITMAYLKRFSNEEVDVLDDLL